MVLKKLLGQIMAKMGFITRQQLNEALQRQKRIIGEKLLPEQTQRVRLVSEARRSLGTDKAPLLGEILVDMGFATKEQLEEALGEQDKSFEVYKTLEKEKLGIAIETGSLLNSTLNLAEVLDLIMRHVNQVTNSVASTLMLIDDKTGELVFSIPTGPKADKLTDIRIPRGKGIAGWVAEHKQSVLIPNAQDDSKFYPEIDKISGFETKSILCVPLEAKTKLIGVLEVINKVDGTSFTEEDIQLLSIFGHQAAVAIENTRLHNELTDRLEEQKETEQALRESKENLDKAQEIAHIGSWSRDMKTDQGHWSDEMYRTLGLTPGNPENPKHEDFLSRVHPDDRGHLELMIKKAVEERGSFEYEFRTVPINASERIIHSRGEVECDEAGIPVRRFGINQDVTETRHLQTLVLEGQKTEAISTLAGGIAHNFNNALTPIIGNIDLLEMAHGQDEKTMGSLKDMKTSGLRMAHLTSQLLAYAEGGKYNPHVLSLSDFVDATLPLIQHTLDPAVRVETDLPLDIKDVEADGTQMQMVLSAIMANSNEAMEGPGRIRISTRNMDLGEDFVKDHPGLKPGPHVCLSVKDDGKGMDEETRRRIFDPFFTTHFMGRGLGMASVYGIIKNHDGAITVDSEPGKGTVVRIYLPAISADSKEQGAKAVKQPEVEIAMGEGTILVIEDEEDVMMMIRQVLERLGYRVLQAETGKKAVKLAKTFDGQIDLALLDIKLPDMTGDKVYPLIMEARPGLKVIVCSGYTIDGPPLDILDAGAEGFIQKPFSIAAFADKLKEVLEGSTHPPRV